MPKQKPEIDDERGEQTTESKSASELIDARIGELGDWRGEMLGRLRALVKEADPDVVEEWKWRGVPVWSHDGMICTGETYKNIVKMTFAKGAALEDPSGLFNSSLDGNTRRAIDFHEGEKIDEQALKTLVRAAATLNRAHVASASIGKYERKLLQLLREVVAERRPELLPLAEKVGTETLTREQLDMLQDVVEKEFTENGLQEDWEPNPRGIMLDDLIGLLALRD